MAAFLATFKWLVISLLCLSIILSCVLGFGTYIKRVTCTFLCAQRCSCFCHGWCFAVLPFIYCFPLALQSGKALLNMIAWVPRYFTKIGAEQWGLRPAHRIYTLLMHLSPLGSGLAMSLLLSGVGLASLLRRLEDLFPLKGTKSRFAMSNFPD